MFGWRKRTERRLDDIEKRLEAIERAIGLGYSHQDGAIYASSCFRYNSDQPPRISEVVATLAEKAKLTVCPARGPQINSPD